MQSVARLIAPVMVVMAAASAIADGALVAFERLLGRDETAEGARWDAAGVLARLPGFEILAADDISVVWVEEERGSMMSEKSVWLPLSEVKPGECVSKGDDT